MMGYENRKRSFCREFLQKRASGVRLGKSSSNLFRYRKKARETINARDFCHVLSVGDGFVEAEGMATYEDIVKESLKHGVMPAVVPELKTITAGGAVSGVGIESSSFRYGLVHETVQEMEVMLGDGSVVTCRGDNEHKDLFFGLPNSYGTLGYILKLKLSAVPVMDYVRLEHKKFGNFRDYFSSMDDICADGGEDFVDGTIFSREEMYLTKGKFVDDAHSASDYRHMKIYYKSIKKNIFDYLTIEDYIWRWDTDWFWCSSHFGAQNPAVRAVLGKWLLKSESYWKLRDWNAKFNPFKRKGFESVVQDVEIPVENAAEFAEFFFDEVGIAPVWVCPVKPQGEKFDLYEMDPGKLYINFGFWDVVKSSHPDGFLNRKIEKKVRELGGKKSLYSTSFYPEKEFRELYNGKRYDELKEKYDPSGAFKNLYEKCVGRK